MSAPTVFGPAMSTYVRTVCMVLQEKEVAFRLEDVDIVKGANRTPEYLARHPFGKVPAFEHDGLALYETGAITRYVDEAFRGPSLQPADVKQRARMNQVIGVIDAYGYGCMIGTVVMQRLIMPLLGATTDEQAVLNALPMCQKVLQALEQIIGPQPCLAGEALSLADLYLVPIYDYFSQTPDGKAMLGLAPNLGRWWTTIGSRPSVVATRPKLG